MSLENWRPGTCLRRPLLLLALLASGGGVHGQEVPVHMSDAYAPVDHWSRAALRRHAAAGLLQPGAVLTTWPIRLSRVNALLTEAVQAQEQRGLSAQRGTSARSYLERFQSEHIPHSLQLRVRGEAGVRAREGDVRAGTMFWQDGIGWVYPGPTTRPDAASPFAAVAASVTPAHRLTVAGAVRAGTSLIVEDAYAALAFREVNVWAGRRALSMGAGHREGIVLSEGHRFDGAGIELDDGITLPSVLRVAGPFRAMLQLARMSRSGVQQHPWFMAQRVSVAPHRSLSIGANRAAIFGGGDNIGISPTTVALMLAGFSDTKGKDSDFENQVFSMDALWSTALRRVPIAFYVEGGIDDTGQAFLHVPSWIFGAELPAIPGAGSVAAGIEHVRFPASCCRYPPWYRHGALGDGWTDRGSLLGHPLGGEGTEWSLRWRFDPAGGALLSGGRFFTRRRGAENLFAPDRLGRSAGAALDVVVNGTRTVNLKFSGEVELGANDWRRSEVSISAERVF